MIIELLRHPRNALVARDANQFNSQRLKRDRSREDRTPPPPRETRPRATKPASPQAPPRDIRSGSEEGEIEEEG